MKNGVRLNMTWGWKQGWAILLLFTFSLLVVIPSGVAFAAEEENGTSASAEAGLGIGSGLLTLVYLPLKVAYAALGGIIGGFAYALTGGDLDTAKTVWKPSFYGTYVITPDHLKGNEPVRFYGVSPYDENEELGELSEQ